MPAARRTKPTSSLAEMLRKMGSSLSLDAAFLLTLHAASRNANSAKSDWFSTLSYLEAHLLKNATHR